MIWGYTGAHSRADEIWARPEFVPKRRTVNSYQNMKIRLLIILAITLPFLIRMCFATPHVANAQALLISTTAMVSTLVTGIVLYDVAKHMSGRRQQRRPVYLSERHEIASDRTCYRIPTADLLTTATTNLGVYAGPFIIASSPVGLANNRSSMSSGSGPSSPISLETMGVTFPSDDPPYYYDVAMAPLPEVHRYAGSVERAETPPPSYEEAVG